MKTEIKGTYEIHVGNYDWGSSVDRAILTLNQNVDHVDAALLTVTECKMVTNMEAAPDYPLMEADFTRKVESAWLCDEDGNPVTVSSNKVCISLSVSPEEGSPLAFTSRAQIFVWADPYELHIAYDGVYGISSKWEIAPAFTKRMTAADMFAKKKYVSDAGIVYDYAEYIPEKDTDILYVWLHGLGEGQIKGSNCYLPLLGRRGCSMAEADFQNMVGAARVLVPQCPTYWMDADGKETNLNGGMIQADGTSYYTDSLEEFIDRYAKEMKANHIVLAGCSNGGYMCMMLAMSRPDRYDAVVPICEALPDQKISDAQIQKLTAVPFYFVYSNDDPIVVPKIHEIPTIHRLRAAGAKDLHVSAFDKVIDSSGKYKDEDGNPYRYMGHLSWIYYDNNETDDGNGLSAWEWIASKVK